MGNRADIKNLLFDLGGVIMDLDRSRCCRAFERLGMKEVESLLGEYAQKGIFAQLEEGNITVEDFRKEIRKHIDHPVSDKEIDEAFCMFLLGIPLNRLHQIEQLRKRYKVYLLSNTNRLMWDSKIKEEFEKDGFDIDHYFDGIAVSFEAHRLKPDPEIFIYTAEKFHIEPCQTLFFDDSEANCEAARRLGFHALCVHPGDEFSDLLEKFLNKQ